MNKHLRNLNYLSQFVVGIFVLISSAHLFAETRQEHVHQMVPVIQNLSRLTHIIMLIYYSYIFQHKGSMSCALSK
jgi:hypothetical protein